MDGTSYDRIVLSLILIVESTDFCLRWLKSRKTVAKARSTRRFNRILQSVGLR